MPSQIPFYIKESVLGFWFFSLLFLLVFYSPFLQERILFILSQWWWIFLPFIAFPIGWVWWRDYWELRFAKRIYDTLVFLRIQLPQDVERTPKGMEQVLHGIHGMTRSYIPWTDRVLYRIRPEWISIEMVGIGGSFHFIIGCERRRRAHVESHLYSEYPDIQIEEVADYTQAIPKDAPNDQWRMWGVHYVLENADFWILKTYKDWELEKEIEAGRKVDPIAQLGELCASLKAGEQIWIQIIASARVPGGGGGDYWLDKGMALRRSIDKPTKKVDIFEQISEGIADFFRIIAGTELPPVQEEREAIVYRVSELERRAIGTLGDKLTPPPYEVNMRAIYWGAAEVFDRGRDSAINGFFRAFDDYTNNNIRMENRTRLRNRHFRNIFPRFRLRLKAKRILWHYRTRFLNPSLGFRLNTTELASIFHFPGKEVAAPSLKRLPFRPAKPPITLPTI